MRMLKNVVLALVAAVIAAAPAVAEEITDVTGRKVEIALPVKRILLGEARQIHVAAALKGEHVFDTIVGWRDDLIKKDPDSLRRLSRTLSGDRDAAALRLYPERRFQPRGGDRA
ncbi:ABC-type Fe3+-hydroxamate transport system substrate-binding protein [Sinorhizobium fredii]